MTRRVGLVWPDARPFRGRDGRPIRILAASDEPDPTLEFPSNRASLGPVDAVVGCGDLEPDWLGFLGDAFDAPLTYVRGNHDRGVTWDHRRSSIPDELRGGELARVAGIPVAGLPWPSAGAGNARDDTGAWWQSLRVMRRRLTGAWRGRPEPLIVVSHVPPAGAGDGPDAYHLGFAGYRWLMDRVRPPLWLHGHVTTASVPELLVTVGGTTLINVTGSVLVELLPPGSRPETTEPADEPARRGEADRTDPTDRAAHGGHGIRLSCQPPPTVA